MKNLLGSNQYKTRRQVRVRAVILTAPFAITLLAAWYALIFFFKSFKTLKNPGVYLLVLSIFYSSTALAVAPKADLTHPFVKAVVTPELTEHEQIIAYINQVFGKDAPTAFKLLSCENHALNPNAVNRNWVKGQPGVYSSSDWGIFQVNDFYQKTQPKFLLNWKVNVQIAYQLFIENHKHFNLWTCGKALGI